MKCAWPLTALLAASVLPAQAAAQNSAPTVGRVTAQSTRMSPRTLVNLFQLHSGDPFTPELYEKAQDDLHKKRVFKKLEFSRTPTNPTDIHITAEDGYYLFPLAFISGGSKSAAGASVAAGNLFKQGETSFAFAGGSKDGFTTRLGLNMGNHFFTASYTQQHFDQRFYQGGWENVYGVFSTTDDEKKHKDQLLYSLRSRSDQITALYSYRFTRTLSAGVRPVYHRVNYGNKQLDSGNHHHVSLGLNFANEVRAGMNMGALSGYGLTDKAKTLQDLPRARHGQTLSVFYTGGGKWTDSDYHISKLSVEGLWMVELKTRHMLLLHAAAQDAFSNSFTDQITSTDLLTTDGRYDRQHRGSRGAGAGVSFVYYILRNNTGLFSIAPFYEIAYTRADGKYLAHSGAGANLFYKLWRFPLPFGLNYTHNLQDGSHQVGFVIGGAF